LPATLRSVDLRVAAYCLFFWPNSAILYRQDIMYLFCSDSSALLENRLLRAGARIFGTVKVIQNSGSCLIWVDTSMSRLDREEDKIRVELFLPENNGVSANTFDWDLETGTVRFERSWRGVFTTFFSNGSTMGKSVTRTKSRFCAASCIFNALSSFRKLAMFRGRGYYIFL
jgi:hypothetical protein